MSGDAPTNWPTALTSVGLAIAFVTMIGLMMYYDYSCNCNACTEYSCRPENSKP